MKKNSTYILVIILTIFLGACDGSKKEKESENSSASNQQIEDVQVEKLYFDLDIDSVKTLTQGEVFEVFVSDSMDYKLTVRKIQKTVPGLISVAANIEDRETGLASIIIRDNRASGSFELYKDNKLFQIRYDSLESRHYLEEIDKSNMDILDGSAPINIPSKRDSVLMNQ
jgi:PBP1b-binding outer membrane lipoprotein LpoB